MSWALFRGAKWSGERSSSVLWPGNVSGVEIVLSRERWFTVVEVVSAVWSNCKKAHSRR